MNYKEYKEALIDAIKDKFDCEIEEKVVVKNNEELDGIVLKGAEFEVKLGGGVAYPTFYPELYYDKDVSIDEAIEGIGANRRPSVKIISPNNLSKEYIMENAFFDLIGTKGNEKYTSDAVCKNVLDMTLVVKIKAETESLDGSTASFKLTDSICKIYDINKEEILNICEEKTKNEKALVTDIAEFMNEISPFEIPKEEYGKMFIVSNSLRDRGAKVMLFEEAQRAAFETTKENYYALPSSIHEFILIPEKFAEIAGGVEGLKELVSFVNPTLEKQDVLSDSVYYYDNESKEFSIVNDGVVNEKDNVDLD